MAALMSGSWDLSKSNIEAYLKADQPYDCAGAFKIESQGLRLMESVESKDPSALVGLPLIALCSALEYLGYFGHDFWGQFNVFN